MDCRICMEDKIEQKNILHLKCGHELCLSCFDKLIKNTCPYCRETIEDKVEGTYGNIDIEIDITDYIYDISTEIDNILPMSELYYIEDLFYEDWHLYFEWVVVVDLKYKERYFLLLERNRENRVCLYLKRFLLKLVQMVLSLIYMKEEKLKIFRMSL